MRGAGCSVDSHFCHACTYDKPLWVWLTQANKGGESNDIYSASYKKCDYIVGHAC